MSRVPVCSNDPILSYIRREYNATALSKPEERFQPLCVIAWDGKRTTDFTGHIKPLLSNPVAFSPEIIEGKIGALSLSKTNKINTSIGLKLLKGLLGGIGLDVTPLETSLSSVRQISFSIDDVKRIYIDKNQLGTTLAQQRLNLNHLSLSEFKNNSDLRFMVINSIITASKFNVNIEKLGDIDFNVSTKVIEGVLEGFTGKMKMNSTKNKSINFDGKVDLPFAFTCFELVVDWETGSFTGIKHTRSDVPIPLSESVSRNLGTPLTKVDELLTFDD